MALNIQGNLANSLNDAQIRQNLDAMTKGGISQQDRQSYVDNYMKSPDGTYKLKTAQVTPTQPTQPISQPTTSISQNPLNAVAGSIPKISAPFKSTGTENAFDVTGKTLGNLPTDMINLGTGIIDFLNPVKNVKEIVGNIGQTWKELSDYSKQTGENPLVTLAKSFSQTPETAKDALLPEFMGKIIDGDFQGAAKSLMEKPAQNIGPILLIGKGVADKMGRGVEFDSAMSKVSSSVTNPIKQGVSEVAGLVKPLTKNIKIGASKPLPTQEQLTGKIANPKPKDVGQISQALTQLPKDNLFQKGTTYKDVSESFQNASDKNVEAVDILHDKGNKSTYSPKDLSVSSTTKSGKTIKTNFVDTAIKHLQELYTKTNESPAAKVELQNTIDKYKSGKFTSKDVNDLSKQYGTELGSKAFGKNKEQLTSVSAQSIENIRTGLKDTARKLLSPDDMKEATRLDKQTSRFIKAKNYMDKMDESLQKYVRNHEKPGMLQKGVNYAAKVLHFKSFVKGLLGIGEDGTTKLSPLEMEKRLPELLKKFDKWDKMTPEQLIKQADILHPEITDITKDEPQSVKINKPVAKPASASEAPVEQEMINPKNLANRVEEKFQFGQTSKAEAIKQLTDMFGKEKAKLILEDMPSDKAGIKVSDISKKVELLEIQEQRSGKSLLY